MSTSPTHEEQVAAHSAGLQNRIRLLEGLASDHIEDEFRRDMLEIQQNPRLQGVGSRNEMIKARLPRYEGWLKLELFPARLEEMVDAMSALATPEQQPA